MSPEIDKLLVLAKDIDSSLMKLEEGIKVLSDDKMKIDKLNSLLSVYDTELQKRDAYIRKLEQTIAQYKQNLRYW